MADATFRYPVWTRGDLDGFFGLMVDNLVQVLLIVGLCTTVAGLPDAFVFERVLPGVAVSLLIGNLFYAAQARFSARRHGNPRCTALPYGINTPSVFAYVLFIMGPVYREALQRGTPLEAAGELAWKAGLLACLVSGLIEFGGAFVAERLRRATPRAALLGVLAGVALTFIAADFAFRIYTHPLVGIAPLAILMLAYFARYRFPAHLPGGFLAVLVGTALAWLLSIPPLTQWAAAWFHEPPLLSAAALREACQLRLTPPVFYGPQIWAFLLSDADMLLRFLTVSAPMGLLNVLGSLQNIESAEAAGDRFHTGCSLAVNGIGSIAAGLFGSCFPTTIYIGHPAWKSLGARSGYSVANGLFFTACFLLGAGPFIARLIPIEAGAAIVVYIGVVITAQAFQTTPRHHAPAVALGLFPAIAAVVIVHAPLLLAAAEGGETLAAMLNAAGPQSPLPSLRGMVALTGANSGWLVVSLVLAAAGVALIERRYSVAAAWMAAASLLTLTGFLHACRVDGNVIREFFAWQRPPTGSDAVFTDRALGHTVGYAVAALIFLIAARRIPGDTDAAAETIGPATATAAHPRANDDGVQPLD